MSGRDEERESAGSEGAGEEGAEEIEREGAEGEGAEGEDDEGEDVERDSSATAAAIAIGATLVAAIVVRWAFDPARAGQPSMLIALGALNAALAAIAIVRMRKKGELARRFRPAGGDITYGAVAAGALYGAARIVASLVAAHGSPREMWLTRVYLQIGDIDSRMLVGLVVFAVAALEEIAWRGLVMRTLLDVFGPLRALALSSLLFAVAHAPTIFALAMPGVGPNPLLVLAALGCGLVWGVMVLRTQRLVPAVLAHALFTWSLIEFPLWRP